MMQYPRTQHDAIPADSAYGDVHAREQRTSVRAVPLVPVREPIVDTSSWRNQTSWGPVDDTEYALDPADGAMYEEALSREVAEEEESSGVPKKRYARSRVALRPHVVWKERHQQTYLEEMMRWEGRGEFAGADSCPDCQAKKVDKPNKGEYRCRECFVPDLVCSRCCVRRHRSSPFHRIEKWNGTYFVAAALKDLGASIQLNHSVRECEFPIPAHQNMVVLHSNGIHEVAIKYCGCVRAVPHHIQLLWRRLYPASQLTICTCATFELLSLLHNLALTTKSNTYDFYRALERLTINTAMDTPKSRYRALMRMVLQWRHLKLLKRGGRGNEPSGAMGTTTGELGIMCPSCPRPGINLGDDWSSAPLAMRFLYVTFLCMDANFRLKNQVVSNYSQDPGLGIGWAYMVPRPEYNSYALSRAKDSDISTCVGFQALAKANTKFSQGLCYTGVGMVCCGCSEMVVPAAVGNLQKGERYANMDFVFGSALQFTSAALVLISYDICCQWFVNLFKRIHEHWPASIRPPSTVAIVPAIPKMHEPAHGKANHEKFSLNYIPGVGHSDLEAPERIWSSHNALGNATKTQGPGSRQDVLDDHFAFWNWTKYINMGTTLMRRYRDAVAERNIQVEGHRGLSASVHDNTALERWETMCKTWEDAPFPKTGVKNPYALHGITLTETQVRNQLHLDEQKRLQDGEESLHVTTPSAFIMLGLDLEDSQRRIRRLAKDAPEKSTSKKAGGLTEQRNQLHSRIQAWEQIVPIYLPGLLQFQDELAANIPPPAPSQSTPCDDTLDPTPTLTPPSEHPEDTILWLPSAIPRYARRRVCREGLPKIEEKLRHVQLADTLETIRHILRVKARMVGFKNKNIRGQRDGTRSRTMIDRIHDKALAAADKYRASRTALCYLSANQDWQRMFLPLANADIRGYRDPNKVKVFVGRKGTREDDELERIAAARAEELALHERENAGAAPAEFDLALDTRDQRDGTGETRRTLSWIWTVEGVHNDGKDKNSDDILRTEWCKSRARANHATEEVLLLQEEMHRTLKFLDWRAMWWRKKTSSWTSAGAQLEEGVRAYAASQAAVQNELMVSFRVLWNTPLAEFEVNTTHLGEITTAENDDDDDGDEVFEDDDIIQDTADLDLDVDEMLT